MTIGLVESWMRKIAAAPRPGQGYEVAHELDQERLGLGLAGRYAQPQGI